jgi:hypothetical protein
MTTVVAILVSVIFVCLALWHVQMAFTSSAGTASSGAVPSVGGRALFVPSRTSTLLVAVALFIFAGLVLATAGFVQVAASRRLLFWLSSALAFALFVRAVGEFKYVGFFKRVRDSRFARLDTLVYSPLCLLLALGVAFVACADAI